MVACQEGGAYSRLIYQGNIYDKNSFQRPKDGYGGGATSPGHSIHVSSNTKVQVMTEHTACLAPNLVSRACFPNRNTFIYIHIRLMIALQHTYQGNSGQIHQRRQQAWQNYYTSILWR